MTLKAIQNKNNITLISYRFFLLLFTSLRHCFKAKSFKFSERKLDAYQHYSRYKRVDVLSKINCFRFKFFEQIIRLFSDVYSRFLL